MDLSPERARDEADQVFALAVRVGEDMVLNQLRASGCGGRLFGAESGFETGDILAEGAQLMGLFQSLVRFACASGAEGNFSRESRILVSISAGARSRISLEVMGVSG